MGYPFLSWEAKIFTPEILDDVTIVESIDIYRPARHFQDPFYPKDDNTLLDSLTIDKQNKTYTPSTFTDEATLSENIIIQRVSEHSVMQISESTTLSDDFNYFKNPTKTIKQFDDSVTLGESIRIARVKESTDISISDALDLLEAIDVHRESESRTLQVDNTATLGDSFSYFKNPTNTIKQFDDSITLGETIKIARVTEITNIGINDIASLSESIDIKRNAEVRTLQINDSVVLLDPFSYTRSAITFYRFFDEELQIEDSFDTDKSRHVFVETFDDAIIPKSTLAIRRQSEQTAIDMQDTTTVSDLFTITRSGRKFSFSVSDKITNYEGTTIKAGTRVRKWLSEFALQTDIFKKEVHKKIIDVPTFTDDLDINKIIPPKFRRLYTRLVIT